MPQPKLSKLEMQIMEALWTRGACCIREIQEAFPEKTRPAYTTIQTTVYRLEAKKALRRVPKEVAAGVDGRQHGEGYPKLCQDIRVPAEVVYIE